MPQRLYADNAATSFPKPPCVLDAMRDYAERLGASAGRGAYQEAVETGELVARCRRGIARIINAEDAKQIVFGLNCTDMLNLAIHGVLRPGDHAVATRMEHNSVLRPLHALRDQGIELTLVDADADGFVCADAVVRAIRPTTRLVAVQHASNVTGTIQPIAEVGRACRERDVLFLVDAAQTIGHVPIDVRAMNIDLLAFPGHKGLLGPLGTAGLYIRAGVERRVRPQRQGGTGSVSETPTQPDFMPDRYESGSQNAIGLAGLCAAVEWILERGVESLWAHDQALSAAFLDGLGLPPQGAADHRAAARGRESLVGADGVTLHGPRDAARRVAVFSVCVNGLEPAELAALLEGEAELLTRSGIHCAPLAHELLGTASTGGTTRISLSSLNSADDARRCAAALVRIADAAGVTA